MSELTKEGLSLLLERLDTGRADPATEYQDLRLRLYKYFVWKGCPRLKADNLADTTIDRVASKLEQGVEVRSIRAYSCEVARFVFLEFLRADMEEAAGDELPDVFVYPGNPSALDERLPCLKKCLNETVRDGDEKRMILDYYGDDDGQKLKVRRKRLAKQFNVSVNALKVRACRLRMRLEKCVLNCIREGSA